MTSHITSLVQSSLEVESTENGGSKTREFRLKFGPNHSTFGSSDYHLALSLIVIFRLSFKVLYSAEHRKKKSPSEEVRLPLFFSYAKINWFKRTKHIQFQ